jgi:hypothetical protein
MTTMTTRIKRYVIAALAALTVAVASHTTAAPASALPMSCNTAIALATAYLATGNAFYGIGAYAQAVHWYNKAEALLGSAC